MLAKTDKIDARAMARFACAVKPPQRPTKIANASSSHTNWPDDVSSCTCWDREKNRLSRAVGHVRADIGHHVSCLQKRLDKSNKDIEQIIKSTALYQDTLKVLTTVPGIGPATSASLIMDSPELGGLNRCQIAALVGTGRSTETAAKDQVHIVYGVAAARFAHTSIWLRFRR